MKFPVDLLADLSPADLERSAHNYMNRLVYSDPDSPEQLTISGSTKVTIDIGSVGYTPLYGSSDKHKMLGLFPPTNPLTTVALYLLDHWWPVEDILKSSDPARDGVMEVQTPGERIVLYILNRIIYRAKEMSSDELPFLCHGENDYAKILWKNGEAVGFYSVKPSGTLCNSFSSRSYELPVMDSLFVRKSQRGKGFGLQMLEDFVQSFDDDCLGLRYPLTKSMYKVCEKYLCQNPEDADLLWEVEASGGLKQRSNVANKIQAMNLSVVSKTLAFTEESHVTVEVTDKDVVMEAITTQIEEAQSMQCTVETIEEVTVLTISKETDEVPVVTRGRSSGSKRRKIEEKVTEDKSEKVIRIEDIEAETPREVCVEQKTELYDASEVEQTKVIANVDEKAAGEEDLVPLSKTSDTVVDSQDIDEAHDTPASTTEAQAQDDVSLHVITVENVASETQEAEEESGNDEEVNLETVGKETQTTVADSNPEEGDIQQDSEESEATQTITLVKAKKEIESKTPRRRRSQRLTKEPESDGGRVLRRRTVEITPTPKKTHTKQSKSVHEDVLEEAEELNKLLEEESSPQLPDTAEIKGIEDEKVISESETEQKQDAAETQETQEACDDEGQHTEEAVPEERCSERQATDKQPEENHQAEQEEDKTEEENSTEIPDMKEVTSPKGEAPVEETEDVSMIETGENEEAASVAATSETVEDGESPAGADAAVEPHDDGSDSAASKLLETSVVLGDVKTSHDLSMTKSNELPVDEECDANEKEEIQPSGEQTNETSCVENAEPESEKGEIDQDKSVEESTLVDEDKIEVSSANVGELPVEEDETNKKQEEAADEQSEEKEPVVVTRNLRKRKKSSATPRRKSKRASAKRQPEEENEEETTADENTEAEETKTIPEESEEQETSDEKVEEKNEEETPAAQGQDDKESEVETKQVEEVPDVSLTGQEPVEEEQPVVIDTDEQEAAGEQSAAEEEPLVVTRNLRKGRKSAPATPRRKSKRGRMQPQEEEEDISPPEETQSEESKTTPEESEDQETSDKNVEEKNEEELPAAQTVDDKVPEVETEQVAELTDVSLTEQKSVEGEKAAVSEICAEAQENTSVSETIEEATNTDQGHVPVEEDATNKIQEEAAGEQSEDLLPLSEIPDTVVDSQDLDEAHDTPASTTEAQAQDDVSLHVITVENVASETQEAEEESGKDEEVKLETVGMETQTPVADSNPEEGDTQQDSEESEATQTITLVKAKKEMESKTPRRRRSQRLTKEPESDGGRVLRRRTVEITPTPKKTHTKQSKSLHEDVLEEAEELNKLLEEESSLQLPDMAEIKGIEDEKVISESETEQKQDTAETLETQEMQEACDDEGQHTEEAVPEEHCTESQATDKQPEESHQAEQEEDKTEEEKSTEIPDMKEVTSPKGEAPAEETEDVSMIETGENEEAASVAAISETVEDGESPAGADAAVEPHDDGSDSAASKLLETSVVLGDVKTSHDLSVTKSNELPVDEECDANEKEEIQPSGEQTNETACVENAEPEPEKGEIDQDKSVEESTLVDEDKIEVSSADVGELPVEEDETNKTQEEAADEQSEEEEPVVVTRNLRKRKKSSATPRRKSKRASAKRQPEEENEEETTADENTEAEETKTIPEESEEQETSDEKVEEKNEEETPAAQGQDDKESEVETKQVEEVPDVSLTGQEPVEEEQPVVIDTDEQEAAGEQSAAEEEPLVVTRTLRRGRKSAPTAPRRKSKRGRTQHQAEEENEKETTPDDETQAEESKTTPEESEDQEPSDKKAEEKNVDETSTGHKEDNAELANETQVKEVTDVSLTTAVPEICAEEQENTSVSEKVEDTTISDIVSPSEEAAPPSPSEEQPSKDVTSQLPHLQRLCVVLVDMNKSQPEVDKQTMDASEAILEGIAEQGEEPTEPVESVAEKPSVDSHLETKMVETDEEQIEDEAQDTATIQGTGSTEEAGKEDKDEADVSLTGQELVEEDKSAVSQTSAEEQESTSVSKNVEDNLDADVSQVSIVEEEATNETEKEVTGEQSEEEEPVVIMRTLRKGRKSAPATPRRKSKRGRIQSQPEEDEEDISPPEESQAEETKAAPEESEEEATSNEKVENKNEQETVVAQEEGNAEPENEIEKAEALTDVSLTEQITGEEEKLAVLETCAEQQNTSVTVSVEDTINTDVGQLPVEEDAASEQSTEEEPVVVTRTQRKGRKSAPTARKRKSKRGRTQHQAEEENEKETTPDEKTQAEETKTTPEESEDQETTDETVEEKKEDETPTGHKEEDNESEVETEQGAELTDVSLTEQKAVEEEKSVVLELRAEEQENTLVDENGENKTNVDVGELLVEEDKTNETQEEAADEQSEEEPVVVTRTLRKRKKTSVSPRRKSKRASAKRQSEEENEEETTADENTEAEEIKAAPEESEEQETGDEKIEENEEETPAAQEQDDREPEGGTEQVTEVPDVSFIEQVPVEEEQPAVTESDEQEAASDQNAAEAPPVVTRTLRKGRKSTSAAPRRKSKRARTQLQAEEEKEKPSSDEDIQVEQTQTTKTQKTSAHDVEDTNEKESASPKEDGTKTANEMEHVVAVAVISLTGREEEGQSILPEGQDDGTEPPLHTELLEAVTVVSLTKQTSVEEGESAVPESCAEIQEKTPDSETAEDASSTEVGTVPSDEKPTESLGVEETTEPVQEELDDQSVDEHAAEVEKSSKYQNMDTDATVEAPGKPGDVLNLTLDTDEEVQTANVSQDSSEEEVEPTVITKRILRGRSIPSITITPRSKSKRHSANVEKAEESSSDEETSAPASQRRLRKRRSTEGTPIHKSKRRSKV